MTPTGRGPSTKATAPTKTTTTPPTGAGPAAEGMAVAPVSTIMQRGHVNNVGEAWVMMQNFVRQDGGMCNSGDYRVGYHLDVPEGWYETSNGTLTWRPAAPGETQHIEVLVMDSLTGQVLPIAPTVDVVDAQGKVVQSKQLMFLWHPMVEHYGANFSIPTAGTYSLRVRAPAPDFARHDQTLGNRFTAPLDATFPSVTITPKAPTAPGTESETTPPTPPSGAGPGTESGTGTQPETGNY